MGDTPATDARWVTPTREALRPENLQDLHTEDTQEIIERLQSIILFRVYPTQEKYIPEITQEEYLPLTPPTPENFIIDKWV